ncbi:MAG: hypothetical protein NPIRA02_29650 [Nitrospirales bacterium]|nr:MAG: hypothetical protein NPIRA02_29650 [Nitrospirales bacterium]
MNERIKSDIQGKQFSRMVQFHRSDIDVEARTVRLAFSSETDTVVRFMGREILDHSRSSIRLSRLHSGGALLFNHDHDDHIGVVDEVEIGKDRVARARVRFSRSARGQEKFNDVMDGILRNVSVSYVVHRAQAEESGDEVPTFRVTDWEPLEISMVSVPADITVGVGRSVNTQEEEPSMDPKTGRTESEAHDRSVDVEEQDDMVKESRTVDQATRLRVSQPEYDIDEELASARLEAREKELDRIKTIESIAKRSGEKAKVLKERALNDGWSVAQFNEQLLHRLQTPTPMPSASLEIGLSEKEVREYSFCKAILAAGEKRSEIAPMEMEISEQMSKMMKSSPKGFYVPIDVMRGTSKRTLTVGGSNAGADFVSNNLLAGSFIEYLNNIMMVKRLGATVLTGLEGNVPIPKKTGRSTAVWVAENVDVPSSQMTTGQVSLSPKTLGFFTEISRRLLLQSSLDIENLVRMDLAEAVALGIDLAAISGSGSADQPEGLLNKTGLTIEPLGTNGDVPAWSNIVNLETSVAVSNADFGSLGYLTNAKGRGKLKQVEQNPSGPAGKYIWQDGNEAGFGMMNGYRAAVSNQVAAGLTKGTGTDLSALIYGNWADLVIGQWGFLDILVDPYTAGKRGNLQITVHQDVDVAVRRVESFSAIIDMVTT